MWHPTALRATLYVNPLDGFWDLGQQYLLHILLRLRLTIVIACRWSLPRNCFRGAAFALVGPLPAHEGILSLAAGLFLGLWVALLSTFFDPVVLMRASFIFSMESFKEILSELPLSWAGCGLTPSS